jgi:N-hydroxyarylamine O-acetyltransferase
MDKERYLARIRFDGVLSKTDKILATLHRQHLYYIPFENLDVHYKRPFDLNLRRVYQKVVTNFRGGFCYELNLLFNWLLNEVGFSSRIIASRTFDNQGNPGPAFDHMCVYVQTEKEFLINVGFGDLFITPLEIRTGVQFDGRSFFKVEPLPNDEYLVWMSKEGVDFSARYTFSLNQVKAENFDGICHEKQTQADSFFVQNLICTKPTELGRITIFNDRLIEKVDKSRIESFIQNDDELRMTLWRKFGIVIPKGRRRK